MVIFVVIIFGFFEFSRTFIHDCIMVQLSPKTRHYVKNVVALEGAPTADWAAIFDRYRLQNTTQLYSFKLGCWQEYDTTSWKMVQCLRSRSWQELANLELDVRNFF